MDDLETAIGQKLTKSRNPLGVSAKLDASAELREYARDVVKLLASGTPDRQVVERLVAVDTLQLGFRDTNPKMLIPLDKKLREDSGDTILNC